MTMTATMSTPAAARFQRLFGRYIELRTADVTQIVQKKAKSVAIELYKATRATAPSKQEIKQKVLSLGWAVKRPKGKTYPYRKGEKRGSKGPLNRMRAAAITRRQWAIGSAASGFLPAMDALGARLPAKDASSFRSPKGSVEANGLGTVTPKITITNSTPGIVAVESKSHVTSTAFNAVAKDMIPYIRRKQQETASKL